MTDLPDDAIRVVLAAVVPCKSCNGARTTVHYGLHSRTFSNCSACGGGGTRVVVTDVEVERDGRRLDFTPERGKHTTNLWAEVPRD